MGVCGRGEQDNEEAGLSSRARSRPRPAPEHAEALARSAQKLTPACLAEQANGMQTPWDGPREQGPWSLETAGKVRGGSAGYTEASLARKKHARPGQTG